MQSEPLLMIPGPVILTDEVVQALSRPAISHHDPAYNQLLDTCIDDLARLFGTSGRVVLLPGSGRLGLEAAITSIIRPGDRTLHLVNGFFARWMVNIAQRAGAETTVVETAWEHPLSAENVRAILHRAEQQQRPYSLVTVVHSETSTGQLNPVAELGAVCREFDTLLLTDAISSLGCAPLSMENDNIDLCVTASQKGLCAPLGLSVVALGPRALDRLHGEAARGPSQSYALDLARWQAFYASNVPRPYPVVPSPHLVNALHISLRQIFAEGPAARTAHHRRIARATKCAINALGLSYFAANPSPPVSAIRVPKRLASSAIVQRLHDQYNIQIAGGMGAQADELIRISHIGMQATPGRQLQTIRSLAATLNAMGFACDEETAVRAFETCYAEM